MNKPLPLIILVLLTIVCVFLASTFMPEDKQNSKPKKIEDFRLNLNSSGTKLKQFEKQFKAHIKTKSIPTELNNVSSI